MPESQLSPEDKVFLPPGGGLDISGIWKDPHTTVIAVILILASAADVFSGKVTWTDWLKNLPQLLQLLAAGGLMFTNSKGGS